MRLLGLFAILLGLSTVNAAPDTLECNMSFAHLNKKSGKMEVGQKTVRKLIIDTGVPESDVAYIEVKLENGNYDFNIFAWGLRDHEANVKRSVVKILSVADNVVITSGDNELGFNNPRVRLSYSVLGQPAKPNARISVNCDIK